MKLSERLQTAIDWHAQYGELPEADIESIREAIDMARRVESAPSGSVDIELLSHAVAVGLVRSDHDSGSDEDDEEYLRWMELIDGERVRLVREVD